MIAPLLGQLTFRSALLIGWFMLFSGTSWANNAASLPNFDSRRQQPGPVTAPTQTQKEARQRLAQMVPKAAVAFEAISGSPKWIAAANDFLTGPGGMGRAVTVLGQRAIAPGDKHRAVKAFLNEHAALFGHDSSALSGAEIIREFDSSHNGLHTTVWEQRFQNIPVFEALLIGHSTSDGKLVNIGSQFIPDPVAATRNPKAKTVARLSSRQAVARAARNVGDNLSEADIALLAKNTPLRFTSPLLKGEGALRFVWLPMDRDTLRLCWEVTLTRRSDSIMYRLLVDADSGEILVRHCLSSDLSNASYRVFTSDSPSPLSPGYPTPNTNQPPYVLRSLVVTNAFNTNASPNGWINDGDNETRGNNVDAHLDRDADEVPDLPRPQGSPNRVFDFPLDLTQPPGSNTEAAVVNAFYWCNWYHDKLYQFGFTEAAGNFQLDNFGRGGAAGDPVMVDVQDGAGFNNAQFSTSGDGLSPRLSLFIFNGPRPARDSALDTQIILHENTHGLSNRRVGGGAGITLSQSLGLGEGWSDFYALTLLSKPGDDLNGNYPFASYSSFRVGGSSFMDNYYFGIRRYPYSPDLTRNPLTFKDIDPFQISHHPGVPVTSVSQIVNQPANEVHAAGEVWCAALWDARVNLISKYGFSTGNRLILQIVTDGMNLSPVNPTFLQARDAIIQADLIDNSAANFHELWAAFAKRGMGASASAPDDSSSTAGIREAFDLPDDLLVSPQGTTIAVGPPGGPFSPPSQIFTLTNLGNATLPWSVTKDSTWLTLSADSGTLPAGGAAASVTASLNNKAGLLPAGIYTTTLIFSNQLSGKTQSRQFTLRLGQPDYFTQIITNSSQNPSFTSWTFVPDGSGSFYSVCREPANVFPVDPRDG